MNVRERWCRLFVALGSPDGTALGGVVAGWCVALLCLTFGCGTSAVLDAGGNGDSEFILPPSLPAVDAGEDLEAFVGEVVRLEGTASSSGDRALSYKWAQVDGPPVELRGADTPTASFVPTEPGTYSFELVVTDEGGRQASDRVKVTVTERNIPGKELPVRSTFADGDEGWRLDQGAFSVPTPPNYSSDEHYVWTEDASFAYWIAPPKFHGDFSGAYGKSLRFEAGAFDMCCNGAPRLILAGGGITLRLSPAYDPSVYSGFYSVRLDESAPWINDATGQRASPAEMRTVLADISQLAILAGNRGFA